MTGLLRRWQGSGWVRVLAPDDREPARPRQRVFRGPWLDGNQPAHGLYTRPLADGIVPGLTEWVVALNGWPGERWAGPAMAWSHPLVSFWNPILAQGSDADRGGRIDHERWTADAIATGAKAGGYFGIRPRRAQREWVRTHRDVLAVGRIGAQRLSNCCFAAQPGTLADAYGWDALVSLADEYHRVFLAAGVAELADDTEAAIHDHAATQLLQLVANHEEVPPVVCGLALGYPPEVTAGGLLHDRIHDGRACLAGYFEAGALCAAGGAR